MEQRLKESSKQLHALACFLRCSEECSSDIVGEAILDFADDIIIGKKHTSRFEPSNESMLDECSIWESKSFHRRVQGTNNVDGLSSDEELLDPI